MAGIRPGMAEAFAAVLALEGLLARMDAHVLLQVVLQLERLITVVALEFAQHRRLLVADHVTLQAVHVGKGLAALGTRLKAGGGDGRNRESVRLEGNRLNIFKMEAKTERQVHGKRSVMLQNSDRVEDDPLGMRDLSVGEVEETSLEIKREAGEESTAFVVSLLGPINFIFVIKIYSSDLICLSAPTTRTQCVSLICFSGSGRGATDPVYFYFLVPRVFGRGQTPPTRG